MSHCNYCSKAIDVCIKDILRAANNLKRSKDKVQATLAEHGHSPLRLRDYDGIYSYVNIETKPEEIIIPRQSTPQKKIPRPRNQNFPHLVAGRFSKEQKQWIEREAKESISCLNPAQVLRKLVDQAMAKEFEE